MTSIHEVDNLPDHGVLVLQLPIDHYAELPTVKRQPTVRWRKADCVQLEQYKSILDDLLTTVTIPAELE